MTGRQEASQGNGTQGYSFVLDKWPEEGGRKPGHKWLKEAETLARPGSMTAVALSMYLRPDGASRRQIVAVCGAPHMNKFNTLVKRGMVKNRTKVDKDTGHKVYKIEKVH